MNTQKLTFLYILFVSFFTLQSQAQDGYTYTLIDNGAYSYTIAAVPNASSNNFATSVQSYGFTIIVPDGVTISLTSSLGSGASANQFNGTDVGDPSIDGYLITETLGSPVSLSAPSAGSNSDMVTFQVNGSPTSGTMYILENNSSLANAVTPLKSFLQADMEDDGMATYSNRVDSNGSGVSGTSSTDFSTLSVANVTQESFQVFPNPAKDVLHVRSNDPIAKIEIINSSAQLIDTKGNDLENINIQRLQSGIYFLKIYSKDRTLTKKIIKL